jgi:hypothetical protein
VKDTESGAAPIVGEAAAVTTRAGQTVTTTVHMSVPPAASVTLTVAVYVPGTVYV